MKKRIIALLCLTAVCLSINLVPPVYAANAEEADLGAWDKSLPAYST